MIILFENTVLHRNNSSVFLNAAQVFYNVSHFSKRQEKSTGIDMTFHFIYFYLRKPVLLICSGP